MWMNAEEEFYIYTLRDKLVASHLDMLPPNMACEVGG